MKFYKLQILLPVAVLIGTLGISTQQAFANFETSDVGFEPSWPSECGLPVPDNNSNSPHGPFTAIVVGNTVSGSTTAASVGGFITFVLDPGLGSSAQTTSLGTLQSANYLFTGLSPGPHTIVSCFNNNPSDNAHTEIILFTITGSEVVGGNIATIDSTALLLSGAQSFSWMIPVMLSVLGIGLFVVSRKSENF